MIDEERRRTEETQKRAFEDHKRLLRKQAQQQGAFLAPAIQVGS